MFKKPIKKTPYKKIAKSFKKDVIKTTKQSLKTAGVKNAGKVAKHAYNTGKLPGSVSKKVDVTRIENNIAKSKDIRDKVPEKQAELDLHNAQKKYEYKQYKNEEKAKEKFGPEARKERNKAALIGTAIATAPLVADELTSDPVPAIVFREG